MAILKPSSSVLSPVELSSFILVSLSPGNRFGLTYATGYSGNAVCSLFYILIDGTNAAYISSFTGRVDCYIALSLEALSIYRYPKSRRGSFLPDSLSWVNLNLIFLSLHAVSWVISKYFGLGECPLDPSCPRGTSVTIYQ